MNKSFRGIIGDAEQQKIRLSTNNGLTGYKIKKFQTISNQNTSGGVSGEHYTFIWSKEQDSVSGTTPNIDFSDPLLLAVCWAPNNNERPLQQNIIFDNVTVNQDIYITHMDISGSEKNNYYIELEQIKLSENEATMATLKDMRAGPSSI
jgi:hypothetical protein